MTRILPILVLSHLAFPASAATVQLDWGTSIAFEKIITSDGSAVGIDEFKVEVGGFDSGFVPTVANITEWVDRWQVFDAVTNPDVDTSDYFIQGAPTTARFGGSDSLTDGQLANSDAEDAMANNPTATFPTVMRGYIFIRNTDTVTSGAEWGLFTNQSGGGPFPDAPWFFPSTSGIPFTENWDFIVTDTAVVGAIHGGLSVGGGTATDTSTDYLIRTNSVASMPEPSALLTLGTAFGVLLTRRRR